MGGPALEGFARQAPRIRGVPAPHLRERCAPLLGLARGALARARLRGARSLQVRAQRCHLRARAGARRLRARLGRLARRALLLRRCGTKGFLGLWQQCSSPLFQYDMAGGWSLHRNP